MPLYLQIFAKPELFGVLWFHNSLHRIPQSENPKRIETPEAYAPYNQGVRHQRRLISCAASVFASVLAALPAVTQAGQAQTLTTLYNFCAQADCADGQNPSGTLLQTPDGSIYGTAAAGGIGYQVAADSAGYGLIFKISPAGALTVLHSFNGTDGATPATGVIASGGNLYGTFDGFAPEAPNSLGSEIPGGIFQLTPSGL